MVSATTPFENYPQKMKLPLAITTGDLMDEENVLDFLTSLEAMDLPDRIEEVNAKILEKIIEDSEYVAVLFCEYQIYINLWVLGNKQCNSRSQFMKTLTCIWILCNCAVNLPYEAEWAYNMIKIQQ